ncbi:hypothetical protein BDZ97DRAFT_1832727 [Flammula alnicola]|nr:hypothetical protein BDZ97DRAFT_1832727 [Flammula alnicola]
MKLMVGFLWSLNTLDSVLSGHTLYHYMVSSYANPLALLKPTWSMILRVAVISTSNFTIRSLFAHRVLRLSKGNVFLTGWIMVVSLCHFVVGIIITVKAYSVNLFPELSKLSSLFYLMFALGATSDLSVTIILSWLLYNSRTGYSKTDSIIKVLMAYTVNTGMIVAIDATLAMVTYITMPDNFIFLAFYLLLCKLYLNAYLATLNAREFLRKKAELSIQLSNLSQSQRRTDMESPLSSGEKLLTRHKTTAKHMAISIHTLVDQKVDDDFPSSSASQQHSAHAI